MPAFSGITLPSTTPEAMRAAVATVLEARSDTSPVADGHHLPSAERLRTTAQDGDSQSFFSAALEAAYLVAAADGVDDGERALLGELVHKVTGVAVHADELAEHFAQFEAAARASSRTARLEAVTARLDGFIEREEALGFAALVAMADQHFARKEARALIELGETFGFSAGEVQALLQSLVAAIEKALAEQ